MKRKWVRWAILGAVVALLAALVIVLEPWNWEKLDLEKLTQLNQTSIIYDAGGNRAGSLYGSENRVYVALGQIPEHVQNAFIAAEDQRFYEMCIRDSAFPWEAKDSTSAPHPPDARCRARPRPFPWAGRS